MKRRLFRLLAALSLVSSLSSCASTENYEAGLNRWIGASDRDLVMAYGPPDKQYQLDAHTKVISYVKRDTVTYGSGFSTCLGGFGGYSAFGSCYGPPEVRNLTCETVFTITSGKITRWGHKGNNCRG